MDVSELFDALGAPERSPKDDAKAAQFHEIFRLEGRGEHAARIAQTAGAVRGQDAPRAADPQSIHRAIARSNEAIVLEMRAIDEFLFARERHASRPKPRHRKLPEGHRPPRVPDYPGSLRPSD